LLGYLGIPCVALAHFRHGHFDRALFRDAGPPATSLRLVGLPLEAKTDARIWRIEFMELDANRLSRTSSWNALRSLWKQSVALSARQRQERVLSVLIAY
jgi:hypothetical protein